MHTGMWKEESYCDFPFEISFQKVFESSGRSTLMLHSELKWLVNVLPLDLSWQGCNITVFSAEDILSKCHSCQTKE